MRRVVTTVLYIDNSLYKGSKTDWHAPNAICYGAITSGTFQDFGMQYLNWNRFYVQHQPKLCQKLVYLHRLHPIVGDLVCSLNLLW